MCFRLAFTSDVYCERSLCARVHVYLYGLMSMKRSGDGGEREDGERKVLQVCLG